MQPPSPLRNTTTMTRRRRRRRKRIRILRKYIYHKQRWHHIAIFVIYTTGSRGIA